MPRDLIENVCIAGDTVTYKAASGFANAYLKEDLRLRYPAGLDLQAVPRSILIAPFFLSVLPIILLSGGRYRVRELDRQLAGIVEPARRYLENQHPSLAWQGDISVERPIDNGAGPSRPEKRDGGRVGVLFTGGVDSYYSLLQHLNRNPVLVAVGGADMPYAARNRWAERSAQVAAVADRFGLEAMPVDANLFEFIAFERLPLTSWWSDAQVGLSLIGICLPLLHLMGCTTAVIAASGTATCPSSPGTHPDLEGAIRCAQIVTSHHGFDVERQQKVAAIVAASENDDGWRSHLNVCLRTYETDRNCCRCEKCLRTIAALIVEDTEPRRFGFDISVDEAARRIRGLLGSRYKGLDPVVVGDWREIQHRILQRAASQPAAADLDTDGLMNWIARVDLDHCAHLYNRRRWFRDKVRQMFKHAPGLVRAVMDAERRAGRVA